MDTNTAKEFLSALGASTFEVAGEWVRTSCPLARWKHRTGKDSSPSFGVKTGERPFYNCFACRSRGAPMDLVLEIMHLNQGALKLDLAKAMELAEVPEVEGYVPVEEWNTRPTTKPVEIWPEEWLESFPLAWELSEGRAYLKSRGVGKYLANAFSIRYDINRNTVCFPVRNTSGQLIGMRGRYLDKNAPQRFHDYSYKGKRNTPLWLNAHRVDLTSPVVLVESSFDCVAVYRYYHNVVAPLSAGVSIASCKWLTSASEVLLLFDNDEAGHLASQDVGNYLSKYIPVTEIEYPQGTEGQDPGSLSHEQLSSILEKHVKLTLEM